MTGCAPREYKPDSLLWSSFHSLRQYLIAIMDICTRKPKSTIYTVYKSDLIVTSWLEVAGNHLTPKVGQVVRLTQSYSNHRLIYQHFSLSFPWSKNDGLKNFYKAILLLCRRQDLCNSMVIIITQMFASCHRAVTSLCCFGGSLKRRNSSKSLELISLTQRQGT